MVREIPLTRGYVALVDDEDYDRVSQFKWRAQPVAVNGATANHYAITSLSGRTVFLHRFILNAPRGMEVDHRNRNGIDCRRNNIRLATTAQNQANRGRTQANRSGYKGVSWSEQRRKWLVQITCNGERRHVGRFDDPTEAALAYDRAARDAFGAFARLNYPTDGEQAA
jgi:hypothetical protein